MSCTRGRPEFAITAQLIVHYNQAVPELPAHNLIAGRAWTIDRIAMLAGPVMVAALFALLAGWTGPDSPSALLPGLDTFIRALPLVAVWLGSAVGLGWIARQLIFSESRDGLLLQIAVGVAIMLWLDAALGSIGMMFPGDSIAAWVLAAFGLAVLGAQILQHARRQSRPSLILPWLWWTAAPALAVLLVAVTSAPGFLWASEFGGYDALSYHLQLPHEWITIGRIVPLEHNVYSFLPGYVEAAFAHVMLMQGDAHHAAYACQLLHAVMAILTALLLARFVHNVLPPSGTLTQTVAGVTLLGTPWVIITGSLAYNEMFVTLMLAAGLLILADDSLRGWRRGAVIGIVTGAACGAKLTALGFVALPLVVLMLSTRRDIASAAVPLAAGALLGALMLAPWLLRNWIECGNPLFPFLTTVFGEAHWTAAQISNWQSGHFADLSVSGRLRYGFDQLFRYGIGPNADSTGFEPWKPQWSVLPWLGMIGLAIGMFDSRTRRWSIALAVIFVLQLLFWMMMTHIKSRFMLPSVVPLAAGCAVGLSVVLGHRTSRGLTVVVAAALLLTWCSVPIMIYRSERDGMPAMMLGNHMIQTGENLSPELHRQLALEVTPVVLVNEVLADGAHVLLIGESTPFYYDSTRIRYQTTWDRGPLSEIVQHYGDDSASWITALRDRSFTHVLVNANMLSRWHDAGWGDPLLEPERLIEAFDAHADLLVRYPGGIRVYALR